MGIGQGGVGDGAVAAEVEERVERYAGGGQEEETAGDRSCR